VHQIKLFRGLESDLAAVEREVNAWLASSDAKVVQVFGNVAPQTPRMESTTGHLLGADRTNPRGFVASDIFLAVVYEK
jgi:hypothetical protein